MLKSILQKFAVLIMVVSMAGGLVAGANGADTNVEDANVGIAVCHDLDTPIEKA